MGLVDYSDSEGSDVETPPQPVSKVAPATGKPAFPKVINRSEPRKIKVDLPSVRPEPVQQQDEEQERPAKRARTGGGAFGGFNSLLPAPKGRVQSGPKPGVSLKTSSEAAFSRAPVDGGNAPSTLGGAVTGEEGRDADRREEHQAEPKMVGKATKFKPLSVANTKKKSIKKSKPTENEVPRDTTPQAASVFPVKDASTSVQKPIPPAASAPKPKLSLFSVPANDEPAPEPVNSDTYEAVTTAAPTDPGPDVQQPSTQPTQPPAPNTLSNIASDLNLTRAQKRQLFGRNAKDTTDVNIAHFNMDSEYAANEQARQAGEVVEHRAVKAIAPGKHSLQQLVNNAKTQQGAMEDKWADGRRERGEAGGKYGWGK